MLYEFLIGVPPLWAESVEELFDLIKSGKCGKSVSRFEVVGIGYGD